ncbi:beta-N-acetylhexosaminidase [Vibrio sp.]|nr:beta-N-acetylhexosaminidase [Vibrio sp.]
MGPVWLDIAGYELDAEDKELLEHPSVGGLILFSRNYHDNEQLLALNKSIRKAAKRPILIGVDQEGGRVQRFREGFSTIPTAAEYARHSNGEWLAKQGGWLMAAELIAHDIDLSFAPVLDTGFDCKAIGERAFSDSIDDIIRYSRGYLQGMKAAGMATTGKHFPGHGGVIADSHLETPYDHRDDIIERDMKVFQAHMEAGLLDAMMPAHVIYPYYDVNPASGSEFWLQTILRKKLNFNGIVFSDDLTMEGAAIMGSTAERAKQSLKAGCDMVLVCNKRDAQIDVLDNLPISNVPAASQLLKTKNITLSELRSSKEWKEASEAMKPLIQS